MLFKTKKAENLEGVEPKKKKMLSSKTNRHAQEGGRDERKGKR